MSSIITIDAISDFTVDGDGLVFSDNEGLDFFEGSNSGDRISGGAGDDELQGRDGNDLIFGGSGNNEIGGGNGDDLLIGGEGDDTIFGFGGNDTIEGNGGNDLLFGGDGIDQIFGGEGNDTLVGGAEADLLQGGAGNDVFEFDTADFRADTQDVISDFSIGEDSIVIKGLSSDDSISIDPASGSVLFNGQEVVKFGGSSDTPTSTEEDGDDFLLT